MNALEKIKGSVNDGVKAIEGKITQLEAAHAEDKALREKQKADRIRAKEKEAKARAAARSRKRRRALARRIIAGMAAGLVLFAVGAWYALGAMGVSLGFEMPVQPVWVLGVIALGLAAMLTGRLIPAKIGVVTFGVLLPVRENGWLCGVLNEVSVWKMLAASGILVAVIYITWGIVNLKNGAKRRWQKTRKAIDKKTENIRMKIERTAQKLKKK